MARSINKRTLLRLMGRLWPHHEVQKGGEEHLVHCPFCASESAKCSINPEKGVFQCWVCGERGPVKKLLFHLRDLGNIKQSDVEAVIKYNADKGLSSGIEALYDVDEKKEPQEKRWSEDDPCAYPPMVYPLLRHKWAGFDKRLVDTAVGYLGLRGFNEADIEDYDIHFCAVLGSAYYGHIFFPVFSRTGNERLFWTTRTVISGVPKSLHASSKYSRYKAKHILFNQQRISRATPLAITEGPFDAFSVTKHVMPAVALFGKVLHPYHLNLLSVVQPPEIYVVLDPEARKDAIRVSNRLRMLGKPVYTVHLSGGDPNDLHPEDLKEQVLQVATGDTVGLAETDKDLSPRDYWSPLLTS